MKVKHKKAPFCSFKNLVACLLLAGLGFFTQAAAAQTVKIPLDDLSSFRDPGKSWQIAGEVVADLEKVNELEIKAGKGVLVNDPSCPFGRLSSQRAYTPPVLAELRLSIPQLSSSCSSYKPCR